MHKRILAMLAALPLIVAALFTASPASANVDGNYAQVDSYFSCGANFSAHVDVHFNHIHDDGAQEFAYGTYLTRDAGSQKIVRIATWTSAPAIYWQKVLDYTYGQPGVTTVALEHTAGTWVSTGRVKWQFWLADGTVCGPLGNDGSILYGKP